MGQWGMFLNFSTIKQSLFPIIYQNLMSIRYFTVVKATLVTGGKNFVWFFFCLLSNERLITYENMLIFLK